MSESSKTAYFTICSLNYLPTAKILIQTLQKNTVNEIFLIICDKETDGVRRFLNDLNVSLIFIEDIGITNFKEFILRYSILELNTSIKPFVFNHLFERGFKKVFYFDPDISIEGSLHGFEDILDSYDAILTPHILSPFKDNKKPNLKEISDSGIYNLGFLGLKSNNTKIFLDWWMHKCKFHCYSDVDNGLFTDQKFCNYLPVFVENTKIYNGPEANIAYWNLHEREITERNNKFFSNQKEVLFFHFSGIVYDDQFKFKLLSKHENRYRSKVGSSIKNKIESYLRELSINTKLFNKIRIKDKYTLNEVDGIFLDRFTRGYIKEIEKRGISYKLDEINGTWFFKKSEEFENTFGLTRYFLGIYYSRRDLREAFNIESRSGIDNFLSWINNEIIIGNLSSDLIRFIPKHIKRVSKGSFIRKFLIRFSKYLLRKYPYIFSNPYLEKLKFIVKKVLLRNVLKKNIKLENMPNLFSNDKPIELEKAGVNIFGYFKESTGLAIGAKLMSEMLQHANLSVSRNNVDINDNSIISKEHKKQKTWDISLFHINADQTQNVIPALEKEYLDTFRIGYWAWELERFPSDYLKNGEYLNDLWVPSSFIANSIERSCNFIPKIIPHPVRKHSSKTYQLEKKLDIEDKYIVTGTMDLNSYSQRKNPIGILEAYSIACKDKAFKDESALIIKLSGSFDKDKVLKQISNYRKKIKAKIIVIDKLLSGDEMMGLRNITDVFMSLHRSEGFGLNLIENMSAGNLVIATNYSGNIDFMNNKNSLLVDYKLIPVRKGQYPKWEGQFWADPSVHDASEKLLWSYKNSIQSEKIAKYAKSFVLKNYSVEKISDKVLKAINAIK